MGAPPWPHVAACVAHVCIALAMAADAVGDRAPAAPPRFVLYTRAFHDAPFIQYWVDWHLALGFDRVVLLDLSPLGMSVRPTAPDGRVHVHRFPNTKNRAINLHQRTALHLAPEWVMVADTDELLLLNARTIGAYVDGLERRWGKVDVVQFQWALYEHVRPFCSQLPLERMLRKPPGVLLNRHVKSMTRVFPGLVLAHPHFPTLDPRTTYVLAIDGVARRVRGAQVRHMAAEGIAYATSALLHVHTRSIANLLDKAVFGLATTNRKSGSPAALARLLSGARRGHGELLVRRFYKAGGTKAQLPAAHVGSALVEAQALNVSNAYAGERVGALLAGAQLRGAPMCSQPVERAEFARALLVLNSTYRTFESFAADLEAAFVERFAGMVASASVGGSPWGRRRRRMAGQPERTARTGPHASSGAPARARAWLRATKAM